MPRRLQPVLPPKKNIPRIVQNSAGRVSLQSADGKYSIGLTGDIQFNSGAYLNFNLTRM